MQTSDSITDHAKKQLKQLATRVSTLTDHRIPIGRLERFGRLESDVLKAGDEIRFLARFTSTQRTAFRKLLKKYKRWTGSSSLEIRLSDEVFNNPKSFTNLDLGPLLDDYSQTLQNIRSLFETSSQPSTSGKVSSDAPSETQSSAIDQLRSALRSGSKVDFDTAIATIPLGEHGSLANYFVHPDNVVELQVLLLQYMEYQTSRSRSNSVATPVSSTSPVEPSFAEAPQKPDYFMLAADDLNSFAKKQGALTVDEREHAFGITPQRAKACIRWNNDDAAVLSVRSGSTVTKQASLKSKHVEAFFDRTAATPKKNEAKSTDNKALAGIRADLLKDDAIQPLYMLSACRSRLVSVNNAPGQVALATFDTSISIRNAEKEADGAESSDFPYAVLQVRMEGGGGSDLLSALDQSHLVERVRGFSLQYHALWQVCNTTDIPPPFWMPILSRDIRKLPPPALKRESVADTGSGSRSAAVGSTSSRSGLGVSDATTAVDTGNTSSVGIRDQLEVPPLRSFRKKRRRRYPEPEASLLTHQNYWSEYDHPEDGEGGDAYVIYIDPNERSTLDRMIDKLSGVFKSQPKQEEEPLLQSPIRPDDDHSSDEEESEPVRRQSYGTVVRRSGSAAHSSHHSRSRSPPFLPQVTSICLVASIVILIVAYILATTSHKHRYAAEVSAGIIFAIVCSVLFAVVGFIPLLRRRDVGWLSYSVAAVVLIVDAVCSGGLLAWVLG